MAATSRDRYMRGMDQPPGILIVEDRGIVAGKIRRELERAGFVIAGVTGSRAAAIRYAETLPLHGAVLDIDLHGEPSYPVAQALRERAVPFVFLSGYSRTALPRVWRGVHLVEKPFEREALLRTLDAALLGAAALPPDQRVVTPAIRP